MNKKSLILCALVFFFAFAGNAHASTLGTPPNNLGLAGYWTFDGKDTNWATGRMIDRSGNGNTGLMTLFSTTTSTVLGKIGQALNFNGTSNNIRVLHSTSLNIANTITVSAWIKVASHNSDYREIVRKNDAGGGWFLLLNAANKLSFTSSGSAGEYDGGFAYTADNQWHMVTGTFDGTTITLYKDGVFQTSFAGGSLTQTTDDMRIGSYGNASQLFQGPIDDVRVYNRALSATEVKKLYNAGAAKQNTSLSTFISNGLVGHWTFDGKDTNWATNQALDTSGNGAHGRFISMSTTTSSTLGIVGQALSFVGNQGLNTNISVLNLPTLNVVSVSAWVKTTLQPGANGSQVVNRDGMCGADRVWQFRIDSTGLFRALFFNTGGSFGQTVSTTVVNDGKWHLLTATWDGSTIRTYVDGTQDGTPASLSGTLATNGPSCEVYITGETNQTQGTGFIGAIDEVRIYNRAISAAEVKQLYTAGAGSKTGVTLPNKFASGGLISYWSLNGKDMNWATGRAVDGSGSGNTGRLTSLSTTTSPVTGKIGQGISFNGSAQYIIGSNTINIPLVTMSVWVKKSGNPSATNFIAGFQDGLLSGTRDKELYILTDGTIYWYVFDGSLKAVTSTAVVTDGKWHHVVGTADGTNMYVYVDGVQSGTLPAGSTFTGYSVPNVFLGGLDAVSNPTYLNAQVDEFRVYNRALSVSEIKALYNQGR